jgi:hypothetical protein
VRFNSGGSGEFISEDGLILSNHHVGADTLQKVSTKEKDYLKKGFYAKTLAEEIKAPDLELNVLMSIEDVTGSVNAAVTAGASDEESFKQRRAVMAAIEKESKDKTGSAATWSRCIRRALSPLPFQALHGCARRFRARAADRFLWRRPGQFRVSALRLDVCFFRAYEDGKPAKIQHISSGARPGRRRAIWFCVGPSRPHRPALHDDELDIRATPRCRARSSAFSAWRCVLNPTASAARKMRAGPRTISLACRTAAKRERVVWPVCWIPNCSGKKAADEKALREKIAAREDLKDTLAAYDRIASRQKIIAENARTNNLLEGAARSTPNSSTSRARCSGPARNGRNRTANACANSPKAGASRWNSGCFPTSRFIPDLEELHLTDSLTYLAEDMGSLRRSCKRCSPASRPTRARGTDQGHEGERRGPSARSSTRAAPRAVEAANDR